MPAEALLALAWKTFPFCCGALLLLHVARDHSPAQRARLAFLGILLVPVLPLLSAVTVPVPVAVDLGPSATLPFDPWDHHARVVAVGGKDGAYPTIENILLLVWVVGAAALILRLIWGLAILRHWTRNGVPVQSDHWHCELGRFTLSGIRLLAHKDVESPLTWGWRRPVILIGPDQISDETSARSILAHEVAHIRRGDWAVVLISRAITALFWFNPFVWLLERAFLREMEEAADADAIQIVQPYQYAKVLLRIARSSRLLPARAMASSAVGKRIEQILAGHDKRSASCSHAGLAVAIIGLALSISALQLISKEVVAGDATSLPENAAVLSNLSPQSARTPGGYQSAPMLHVPGTDLVGNSPAEPSQSSGLEEFSEPASASQRDPLQNFEKTNSSDLILKSKDNLSASDAQQLQRDAQIRDALARKEAELVRQDAELQAARARREAELIRQDEESQAERARKDAELIQLIAQRQVEIDRKVAEKAAAKPARRHHGRAVGF